MRPISAVRTRWNSGLSSFFTTNKTLFTHLINLFYNLNISKHPITINRCNHASLKKGDKRSVSHYDSIWGGENLWGKVGCCVGLCHFSPFFGSRVPFFRTYWGSHYVPFQLEKISTAVLNVGLVGLRPQSHNPTIPQSHNPTIPQSSLQSEESLEIFLP